MYKDTGLSSSTTYYYKVSATNTGGESAQSSYNYRTTLAAIPTGLNIRSATSSSLTVSWNPISGAGGYRLYRSTSPNGTFSERQTIYAPTTTFIDTGLTAGTTYYYKVSFYYNGASDSPKSSYVSGTTTSISPSLPPAPADMSVGSATSSSLTVSWVPVSGAGGYRVYRASSANGTFSEISFGSTATTYTDSGLAAGITYYYKVCAYNGGGSGPQSNAVSGTTLINAPTVTTSAATNITSTSATLNASLTSLGALTSLDMHGFVWSKTPNPDIMNCTGAQDLGSKITTGAFSINATGLTPGTTYYVRAVAYSYTMNNEVYGPQISFTTLSTTR